MGPAQPLSACSQPGWGLGWGRGRYLVSAAGSVLGVGAACAPWGVRISLCGGVQPGQRGRGGSRHLSPRWGQRR